MTETLNKTILLPNSGVEVFYREQNPNASKVFLLLHGFPASSFQYRHLIPLLATKYRVIAPDLPGFGFTKTPDGFKHSFESIAAVTAEFLDVLSVKKFSVYVFDYGAPTGFRLALQRPDAIEGIVSQNGNAYFEGLGDFWEPVKQLWASDNTPADRKGVAGAALSFEAVKSQYTDGEPNVEKVDPVTYTLDYALMQRPGNSEIQVDLFKDYETNVALYGEFQEYFRKSQVPLLAIWGKNDDIFVPAGAEAFKKDLPNAVVKFVDAGHFAVETNPVEISREILKVFT